MSGHFRQFQQGKLDTQHHSRKNSRTDWFNYNHLRTALHENESLVASYEKEIEEKNEHAILFEKTVKKLEKEPKLSKNDLELNDYIEKTDIKNKLELEKVTDKDVDKINKLAVKPVKKEDVVVYPALLIDDQVTQALHLQRQQHWCPSYPLSKSTSLTSSH